MSALNFTPNTGTTFADGITYILRNNGVVTNQRDRTSYSLRVRFKSKFFPTTANVNN